jgi:hypothetical protein
MKLAKEQGRAGAELADETGASVEGNGDINMEAQSNGDMALDCELRCFISMG